MENDFFHGSLKTGLHLFKENFKFSSAHFLILDAQRAERLHGHNYSVRVDLELSSSDLNESQGFFIDFATLKKDIKTLLDSWDEHILLPGKNPEFRWISREDRHLEVYFRDRKYLFPENEVLRLPITNTSVEQLSQLLLKELLSRWSTYKLCELCVWVEESSGQSGSALWQKSNLVTPSSGSVA